MLIILSLMLMTVIIFFSIQLEKNWSNPLTLFTLLWVVICVFAGLKLFGMYEYSENVFLIILLGNIGVFCGYVFGKKVRFVTKRRSYIIGINENASYHFRDNVIMVFMCIAVGIYLLMAIRVLELLHAGYDTATIREMYRDTGTTAVSGMASSLIFGSSIVKQLESIIAQPVMRAGIPVFAIEITKKGKITLISFISLALVLLYTFTKFGRFGLLYIVSDVVLCYFIIGKKINKKIKRRIKKTVLAGMAIIVIVLLYLSVFRWENEKFTFFQSFYAYFSIPVPLLDYWIKQVDSAKVNTFGFSYILGLMSIAMRFLRRLGISFNAFDVATLYNYDLVDGFVRIFPEQQYNAYVSMFFAFYLDFREVGVFLGSFVFGYMLVKSYDRAKTKRIEYLAFYLLLVQCLIKSFVRWDFVLEQLWTSFIILRLWIGRNPQTDKNVLT